MERTFRCGCSSNTTSTSTDHECLIYSEKDYENKTPTTPLYFVSCRALLKRNPRIGRGRLAGPSRWPRYTVKGEEFSVALPTPPSMVTRKTLLAGTNKNRKERVLQASANDVEYSIYIYENPKPRQSLEDFIREQTANSPREVTSERTLRSMVVAVKNTVIKLTINLRPNNSLLLTSVCTGSSRAVRRPIMIGVQQFFGSLAFGKKRDGFEVKDGPGEAFDGEGGEKFYTGRDVDTKARLISKPDPSYSESARQAQVVGTVVLKVVFAANGKITNIRVVQGFAEGTH